MAKFDGTLVPSFEMDSYHMRMKALDYAVSYGIYNCNNTQDVVAAAEKFFAFLNNMEASDEQ